MCKSCIRVRERTGDTLGSMVFGSCEGLAVCSDRLLPSMLREMMPITTSARPLQQGHKRPYGLPENL
jgi:hypothetical protein